MASALGRDSLEAAHLTAESAHPVAIGESMTRSTSLSTSSATQREAHSPSLCKSTSALFLNAPCDLDARYAGKDVSSSGSVYALSNHWPRYPMSSANGGKRFAESKIGMAVGTQGLKHPFGGGS